jgi:hypothetical protein
MVSRFILIVARFFSLSVGLARHQKDGSASSVCRIRYYRHFPLRLDHARHFQNQFKPAALTVKFTAVKFAIGLEEPILFTLNEENGQDRARR